MVSYQPQNDQISLTSLGKTEHEWVHPNNNSTLFQKFSVPTIFFSENLRHSLFPSRETDDQRILKYDWMAAYFTYYFEIWVLKNTLAF